MLQKNDRNIYRSDKTLWSVNWIICGCYTLGIWWIFSLGQLIEKKLQLSGVLPICRGQHPSNMVQRKNSQEAETGPWQAHWCIRGTKVSLFGPIIVTDEKLLLVLTEKCKKKKCIAFRCIVTDPSGCHTLGAVITWMYHLTNHWFRHTFVHLWMKSCSTWRLC